MQITCDEKIMLRKILVSEKNLSDINFERLEKSLVHMKNNLTDSDNDMYLTSDSFIDRNNIITGSINITLRKFNVKPYGRDKRYMGKYLIEDKLYQLKDPFNEKGINHRDFYFALLDHKNPFYDGNGRSCQMLFYFRSGLWLF